MLKIILSPNKKCLFCLAASAERPLSATSVRGTRQRLQHPNTRRIGATENENNMTNIETRTPPAAIVTISTIEPKTIVEDVKDTLTTPDSTPTNGPLKQLIFKKINTGPVEVRTFYFFKIILINFS